MITVSSGDLSVTIDLQNGGRLSSVLWKDLEFAVEKKPTTLHWGWYAMAPWAGRIRNGLLQTPSGPVQLSQELMPPHAIHGLLFDAHIEVGYHESDRALVTNELPAPFNGGRVEQSVALSQDSMVWTVRYINGENVMPAWLGFHPWYKRKLSRGSEVEIFNPASYVLEQDETGIPTGKLIKVFAQPWDHTFGGLSSDPYMIWPGAAKMTCISSQPWWTFYTGNPDGVCVEPLNAPPNAVELGLAPLLQPGESIEVSYQMDFEAHVANS